jgi:hypothetical protein
MTLDKAAAVKGLNTWLGMVDQGVVKKNVAEVKTPDTVNEFKAGQVLFAINWGFAWDRFKDDADSQVKGKVGVLPLPAMAGGQAAPPASAAGNGPSAPSASTRPRQPNSSSTWPARNPASCWRSKARCCPPTSRSTPTPTWCARRPGSSQAGCGGGGRQEPADERRSTAR